MSVKRQATTELNHENWDQDDPVEQGETSPFKTAPKEVLEKRVFKTAKRRTLLPAGEEPKQSVFSGFGGFNKTQPSSFDFLSKLTNGNKSSNSSTPIQTETVSSNTFTNKTSSSPGGNLFNATTALTPTFGSTNPSLFGQSVTNNISMKNSGANIGDNSPIKSSAFAAKTPDIFGKNVSSVVTTENTKSLFSSNPIPPSFGASKMSNTFHSFNSPSKTEINTLSDSYTKSENKTKPDENIQAENNTKAEDKTDEKTLNYYTKLKGLNECVSDWIKKHVEETPLCILTPIFNDYEKYLKEIQEECNDSKSEETSIKESNTTTSESLFPKASTNDKSVFKKSDSTTSEKQQSALFSSNISGGFSFGINTSKANSASLSPPKTQFSFVPNTTTNGSSPFSFGTGKPFSLPPSTQTQSDNKIEENDEDVPPKVEYTPVIEENSVFDKKCKIFVKKDGNFVDKGVGTLYIKKIEESLKYQLLVRANTNLGNVLLNFILGSSIPTQRMGKNNVMMVCIPTPDSKPPPTPILIRVKSSEEADELLETINKYKK